MRPRAMLFFLLLLIFEVSSCSHLYVTPGASLDLPCLSALTEFTDAAITWTFNGNNVSDQWPGSASIKKDGLFLSISPVTAAQEGEYKCVAKDEDVEMTRAYNVSIAASAGLSMKVMEGSTIQLPCHFPLSGQVTVNARWYKELGFGKRSWLNPEDSPESDNLRVEQLYPLDHDQTILIRNTVMEDAGIYTCESATGERMSTIHMIVEARPTPVPHSCGFTAAWEDCPDENSRIAEPILQESMVEFSMKLYSYLRSSQPSGNLLFSPISISGALSHLLLGARNQTRRAIESAVCVPHDFHCVHLQMKKLRQKMSGSLHMASQIFYSPDMKLSESFTNQSKVFYDAEPTKLLETSEENTEMINNWVANNTNDKIKDFIDMVPPSTRLMLLNAVSFNGQWRQKFKDKPKKGSFTKLNGDLVKVPLIHHDKYPMAMAYVVQLKAQVGKFALTGDSSLYIVLPRTNTEADLRALEEKMTDTAVRQTIEHMKLIVPWLTDVTLPQIKLDVQHDTNMLFKKLGLASLFEGANLCGLTEERLVLDEAKHRAFLALTEQGVEAGGVTALSFSRSSPTFSALRPFILMLWNDQADLPLFIGRVTEV